MGWHTTSWLVLRCLVPKMMLLMMHQPYFHQPWQLDRYNAFNQGSCATHREAGAPVRQDAQRQQRGRHDALRALARRRQQPDQLVAAAFPLRMSSCASSSSSLCTVYPYRVCLVEHAVKATNTGNTFHACFVLSWAIKPPNT